MKFIGEPQSVCPITRIPLAEIEHPCCIMGQHQQVYEMDALVQWIRTKGTNPLTRRVASVSKHVVVPEITGWAEKDRKKTVEKLHEMATARALDPSPFERLCYDFIDGFERSFVIGGNGTLGCGREIREATPVWYNAQKKVICSYIGFEPPDLILQEPGASDIQITNKNKVEMIRAYSYAFMVYYKMCTGLGLVLAPQYTPGVAVDMDA